ncbi:MAG: histidine phosphatase family protein [Sulfurimonas sp.]|jgi:alpha-ribazole phosphatase/probable phosphoglycerate mutase
MKITLIRHAEVDEAYHKRYNGHLDIGLSKAGYEQAKKLAEHFYDLKFDKVFCSDLIRVKESIKNFSQAKNAICTNKLREKSWGRHEGLSFDEIVARDGIVYKDFLQWINALDGEDYESYLNRVKEFFLEYLPSLKKESILVVTHAGVIRVFMCLVLNLSLEEAFNISLPYASYITYDSQNESFSEAKNL